MNQFSNKKLPVLPDRNTGIPQVVLPTTDESHESIEFTTEQIAANINRLILEDSSSPTAPAAVPPGFDALDYARICGKPRLNVGRPRPKQQSPAEEFGELDPYVDPAELIMNEDKNTQTPRLPVDELTEAALMAIGLHSQIDSANQSLNDIDEFQQQLELLEVETKSQELWTPRTTVQFVGAIPMQGIPFEIDQRIEESAPQELPVDEPPPVAWYSETTSAEPETEAPSPCPVVPIASRGTGEKIFDVRDFGDSAQGVITPIPGSFEVDPDLFEFKTMDELEPAKIPDQRNCDLDQPEPESDSHFSAPSGQTNPSSEEKVFMAGTGDKIQINGCDGYDHIDLACFDVKSATFLEQVIQVDDQRGTSFEIHYQDIAYALFADGIEIRLDTGFTV